ncbi:MAG: family 43 glycosylhydrolase, partial [Bacteroidaceae bacterium]|nr:family 43 glycosylhydrolase [Bacteroidaceae bacterium]
MKRFFKFQGSGFKFQVSFLLFCFAVQAAAWEGMALPRLHTEGRYLMDCHGNRVNLHGVMMTPNSYFNNGHWTFRGPTDQASRNAAFNYLDAVMGILADPAGPRCDYVRLHLDPCWSNDPTLPRTGDAEGEANISQFSETLFQTNLQSLFVRLIQAAEKHGLYVILRPPGVCPEVIEAGGDYARYLYKVWDIVSRNKYIRNAPHVMFELANEPVDIRISDGTAGAGTQEHFDSLCAVFQPIVDRIRQNGAENVIWIPGLGFQSLFTGLVRNPIQGSNIGYAAHVYPGWFEQTATGATAEGFIEHFQQQVPVVNSAPVVITENDWSPEKEGEGKYNEFGQWVPANWGTWGTAPTTPWGQTFKDMVDHFDNISWNLSGEACLIDQGRITNPSRAFDGNAETCAVCWDWFPEYAKTRYPRPEYTQLSTADNNVAGTYTNPVIDADFPDPDVIRVGDTFYFLSTTMHHFPGATILKSRDLVNWEYCSNPLERLSGGDAYNLLNGESRYGVGMWASALQYHDGRFHLLLNTNDQGAFLLTATDPAGTWSSRKLDRGYYDGGMLFDTDGSVYIAYGINHLSVCKLDRDFNFQESREVIVRDGAGLEGSHMYHIGDYYYIYSTYGGWPTAQTIFRSKNVWGPYEEKLLVEKTINGKANTVHQGALVDTPTGEWWTFLMEDKGAYGRLPNLQPVRWEDGWPVIGNKGVPYTTYKKPTMGDGVSYPTTYLPTNDNFCDLHLGKQWQWNHQPDNAAWSLLENPGHLRLHTSGVSPTLKQARNT